MAARADVTAAPYPRPADAAIQGAPSGCNGFINNRFFVWISRINSVLLLLALIGAGILATVIFAHEFQRSERRQQANIPVAAEAEPGSGPQRLSLGVVDRVSGTNTLMILLLSEEARGNYRIMSKRGSGTIRNVLFLAGDGTHSSWLFEKHSNLLTEIDELHQRDRPTKALYFEIVQTDSNGDGQLTEDDRFNVALSKPDGSGLTEILSDVVRVLSHQQIDDDQLAVVYQVGDAVWHARFDLNTFAKLSEQAVVTVPQQM